MCFSRSQAVFVGSKLAAGAATAGRERARALRHESLPPRRVLRGLGVALREDKKKKKGDAGEVLAAKEKSEQPLFDMLSQQG